MLAYHERIKLSKLIPENLAREAGERESNRKMIWWRRQQKLTANLAPSDGPTLSHSLTLSVCYTDTAWRKKKLVWDPVSGWDGIGYVCMTASKKMSWYKSAKHAFLKVVIWCWKKWNGPFLMHIYAKQCEIIQKIQWNGSNTLRAGECLLHLRC